ncbi:membrane protein insertion efficiency factor YidD [candidate division NPL-UPA2 bacterium Unc8]|uniref:Putative membrane protein insertion efficiency factor n=1 Tax=candidate division NPL-UPA2 bacterium Unc8 TaxID=1980939 RepID=A0A399FWP6_UNCN2|nr:putative membrane protein insertion efficiency factor [Bacillota bacterium]MBT9138160.1 putative membrane protein insertion efficiency factor [Bacillota bacterium]MBT9147569.1 putative membrane protein insertion efficiency factor [Bacillota bacterium]RIH99631.1 MAG: membrane protein insertion efficiency factor YidD [candidate division NPL-UPA2 bacterium Unc8]
MKIAIFLWKLSRLLQEGGINLIVIYQKVISPFLPKVCRFEPSCSEYAREAVEKYGLKKGCHMAIKRLLRCHPINTGGYDPVKEK